MAIENFAPGQDKSTGAPYRIDYAHHEIHSGGAYEVTRPVTVDDTSSDEVLIVTPAGAKHAHMVFNVLATGETDIYIYEDTTRSGGTTITPRNKNRNYADDSILTITHTPTGGAEGTLLFSESIGLDTGVGTQAVLQGGGTGGRSEIVLKSDTKYLVALDSGTDGNRITIVLDWYEHTDKSMDGQVTL